MGKNLFKHLQLSFTPDWEVSNNIYILGVSPKGSGKTPAGKLFLGALLNLEREEKEAFDKEALGKKENKKNQKKAEKAKKRKSADEPATSIDEEGDAIDGELEDEDAMGDGNKAKQIKVNPMDKERKDRKGKVDALKRITECAFDVEEDPEIRPNVFKDAGESDFSFHPKTRMADSITPEAMFLSLYHGSGVLLLKSDEYKV